VRVQITERHCSVPEDVLERTEAQVRSFAKYDPRASAADVIYTEEKLTRSVEVIMHIDGAEPVVAHGDAAEFRTALDQVVERMRRRLRRQRERRQSHQAPPLSEGIGRE